MNQTIGSRIADWAHWAVTDVITSYDFWWNKKKASLTTTDGTAEYFLSHRVNGKQVIWMGDESNQSVEIKEVPLEHIYRYDSTPTDEGNPVNWAYVQEAEVKASNSSGTTTAVSTSATDLSQIVLIRGMVSSVERYETITLNGTTSATPSSALTWDSDSVVSVTLSTTCVGAVTVTCGGTTIAVIPPGHVRITCPRIRLWRVPDATYTLPYIYYQKPLKLINDSDVLDIPDMAFKPVITGIRVYMHKNNGEYDLMRQAKEEFRSEVAELYSKSTRELNVRHQKDFLGDARRGIPYSLPRIIDATVT